MKNSLYSSPDTSSSVKADPFALADLDRLAGEIMEKLIEVEIASGIDLSLVKKLAEEMQTAAISVTEFFITQV